MPTIVASNNGTYQNPADQDDRRSEIEAALRVFVEEGKPVEIRVFCDDDAKSVKSGFFRNFDAAALAALNAEPTATGVYFVPNPIKEIRDNRTLGTIENGRATDDDLIEKRRWLLIDADPRREAGVSSTTAEKNAAWADMDKALRWLADNSFRSPVIGDSGNGAHAAFPIKLPNDKASKELVNQFLKGLAKRFNTPQTNFDTTVGNASRVWKLYGTQAHKGDNTAERPHRISCLLTKEAPDPKVDNADALRALVKCWGAEDKSSKSLPPKTKHSSADQTAATSAYGQVALKNQCDLVRSAANGTLHYTLRSASCSLGRLVPHILPEDVVAQSLREAAEAAGAKDMRNAAKTVESGIAKGKENPRTIEPLQQRVNNSPAQADAPRNPDNKPVELIIRKFSGMVARPVRWLVPNRIPAGKLILVGGRGGAGKSVLIRALVAAATTGRPAFGLQYEAPPPCKVLLLAAEDNPEDTILPHLLAEGADIDRVALLDAVKSSDGKGRNSFTFGLGHLEALQARLKESPEIKLVIIDPVASYIGRTKIDDHKAAELRLALDPLNDLAEQTGCTVILIAHLNKSSGEAVDRIAGSAAYRDAVRAAYLVAPDPDDDARRLLMLIKENLPGCARDTIPYRLEFLDDHAADAIMILPQFAGLKGEDAALMRQQLRRIKFDPPCTANANTVMGPTKKDPNKVSRCVQWLRSFLATYAFPSNEIVSAGKSQGFTFDNVKEAKLRLKDEGLRNSNLGRFRGEWWAGIGAPDSWQLRPDPDQAAGSPTTPDAPTLPFSPNNGNSDEIPM